jgi:DNA-binding IclR family transcriptional regulator
MLQCEQQYHIVKSSHSGLPDTLLACRPALGRSRCVSARSAQVTLHHRIVANKGTSRNAGGSGQIQVIDRAISLLRILGAAQGPMRLGQIADKAELTPSTTRRILSSLCEHGACTQGSDGAYRLGLLLFELGSRVEAGFDLRERALPALERLSALIHLTVFLCVRHENAATAIERIDGRYAFSLALTVGGSLPLHVGAAPRVFLAYDSEGEIRQYLDYAGPLERFTERTLVEAEDVIADLRESRERGYVISDEDVTPGVAALGAPIFGHQGEGKPVAAISVAGLVPQVLGEKRELLVDLLVETAELISRDLGHGLDVEARPVPRQKRRAA